ncbi:MAG: pseudouridine synthase, partial [Mycolicibacterium sp.]|nr:pseudouridine synthase [Mycolicibacterium sp.]
MPVRDGLGPARVRVQGGSLVDEFERRFASGAKVVAGEVFSVTGEPLDGTTVLPAGAYVYLYRDLPDEVEVPFEMPIL